MNGKGKPTTRRRRATKRRFTKLMLSTFQTGDVAIYRRRARIVDILSELEVCDRGKLEGFWQSWFVEKPPLELPLALLREIIRWRLLAVARGGFDKWTSKRLTQLVYNYQTNSPLCGLLRLKLQPGTVLQREWRGEMHSVTVDTTGYAYGGKVFRSLSEVARTICGTRWSGPRFFGVEEKLAINPPLGSYSEAL